VVSSAASELEVIVLGGAAVDWVARVEALPRKDSIVVARSYDRFPGGSAANVAVGIARLGWRVGFVGKLGNDENGRLLLRAFREEGVDTRGVIVETGGLTSACFIAVDDQGDRVIVGLPGVSVIERVGELGSVCLQGRALYIGPNYTEVAVAAAVGARERGATVFSAPGGSWGQDGPALLRPMLERADVLLVSRSEATELTGQAAPLEAVRLLGRMGPPVVIETVGAQGVVVLTQEGVLEVPGFAVSGVQDTTGAGDAFAAGLIVGFLEGLDWGSAAQMGCATAALKVRHMGARSGLPTREEVARFMGDAKSDNRRQP